jgi:hypothetical protein
VQCGGDHRFNSRTRRVAIIAHRQRSTSDKHSKPVNASGCAT